MKEDKQVKAVRCHAGDEWIIGTKEKIQKLGFTPKPNPQQWPIIDKWNTREYHKVQGELFDIIDKALEERFAEELPLICDEFLSSLPDIRDVHFGNPV